MRRQEAEAQLRELTESGMAPSTSRDGATFQARSNAAIGEIQDHLRALDDEEETLDMEADAEDNEDQARDDENDLHGGNEEGPHDPVAPQHPAPDDQPSGSSSDESDSDTDPSSSDDGPVHAGTDSEDEHDDQSPAGPAAPVAPGDGDGDGDVVGEIGLEHPSLTQPAYPGCPHTLKSCLLLIVKYCIDNKITMEALEHLLQILAFILPAPNRIPRSKYLLFKLLGIEVESYERHVCGNDCHVFPELDPSQYYEHENDACPVCQRARFRRHGASLAPVKKFYVIPIQQQIALLKRNPEFDQSAARMWEDIQAQGTTYYDTFWKGSLAQPILDSMEHGVTDFTRILAFSLGLDGVQVFGHGHYEVWPVGLRIWNVHPEDRGKKDFVILGALVPGPKSPRQFTPYLQPLLEEINRSRQNGGLPTWNQGKGEAERLQFHLSTTQQDKPALAKSSEHIGPSGRVNCHRCERASEPNVLFFFLFCLPQPYPIFFTNPTVTHRGVYQGGYLDGTAATAPRKTNVAARQHSQNVQQHTENPTQFGIKEPSLIATMLPEFDIVYGHMIELFHDLQIVRTPFGLSPDSRLTHPLCPFSELPQVLLEGLCLYQTKARGGAACLRYDQRQPSHLQPANCQLRGDS